MNLLAIDSASSILSIAVAKGEEVICMQTEDGIKHSELAMRCIDNQMKKAGLVPGNLNGVICMGGPGSFTGLRIGFSIAKGLALSLSIPFMPIPTMDCIAFPHRQDRITLTVVEARKNAWFFAFYRGGIPLIQPVDAEAGQIAGEMEKFMANNEKICVTGYGAASLYENLPLDLRKNITKINEKRGYAGEMISIAKTLNILDNYHNELLNSGPEYIRKTDAELNIL